MNTEIEKKEDKESTASPQLAFSESLPHDVFKSRDGTMYQWAGTHWRPLPIFEFERLALKFVAKHFPEKCSEKTASSAAATACMNAEPLDEPIPGLVPCQNGTIIVDYVNLIESDPEHCLTYCLACDFDKDAAAPTFAEFLTQALPDEDIRNYLQEYAGYTLLPDTRHQLACWLIGPGGNGKSTFAEIMQSLHSKPVAMSLDALDGFNLTPLVGASLVYCDETPARIDEQRLKTLVSGGAVSVERKYRDNITVKPTAKWIVSGNSLPAISDHSDGFWRRWVIVPFVTKPSRVQPLLAEHIIERELSGVLNWALAGLNRLLKRGRFPDMPEVLARAEN